MVQDSPVGGSGGGEMATGPSPPPSFGTGAGLVGDRTELGEKRTWVGFFVAAWGSGKRGGAEFFRWEGGGKRVHAQVDQSRYSGTDHDVTRLLFGYRPRGQGSCAG